MKQTFEYPVVHFYGADPEDAEIQTEEAELRTINLKYEPFEASVDTMDRSFHLIFGHQINGFFLCIPNWQFGCELAELDDENWNINSMLRRTTMLTYEDVSAITRALSLVKKQLNK